MSVDILPTSLPLEASESFCKGVIPYVRSVAGRYGELRKTGTRSAGEEESLNEALERATLASGGKLRKQHEWLYDMVGEHRKSEPGPTKSGGSVSSTGTTAQVCGIKPPPKKRILLLGSGMVAGPTVEEICRRKDVELVVGAFRLRSSWRIGRF